MVINYMAMKRQKKRRKRGEDGDYKVIGCTLRSSSPNQIVLIYYAVVSWKKRQVTFDLKR